MLRSRLLAALALLIFIAFFGVILAFVPRWDLGAAVLIGVALAAYDLWTQSGRIGLPEGWGRSRALTCRAA
jgi:MFS superfamily sulfate permease-like transporter